MNIALTGIGYDASHLPTDALIRTENARNQEGQQRLIEATNGPSKHCKQSMSGELRSTFIALKVRTGTGLYIPV
ncbi:hypothetical protein [Pannonibacter indicus]|uniref:Uncharacterized protein n=1 Tax=Pannonibacter indicus TaxID=466044 RepID=A0A0K6HVS4_9HYPH|nr:hypothetical protein [Pannonibacter indicus]CUA94893.1 hypothetical protein Ga0061067_103348 [Pannonibacter indicus]